MPNKLWNEITLATISSVLFAILTNLIIMINDDILLILSSALLILSAILFVRYLFMKRKVDSITNEMLKSEEVERKSNLIQHEIDRIVKKAHTPYRWKDVRHRIGIIACILASVTLIAVSNINKQNDQVKRNNQQLTKESNIEEFIKKQFVADSLMLAKLDSLTKKR